MLLPIPMQVSNPRHVGAQTQPVANVVLILLNVLGYLLQPSYIWAVGPNSAPWTILTYGFIHAGWWHVLFNVWYLWVF
ncbi:MAG: rhomboid family intramembrane serine protease [Planctomycetaceae bacterium]|nr:rhomboid family intramembrane serine protease [Planctomycetaceae bacterium]